MIRKIRQWWWHRNHAHLPCLLCNEPLGDAACVYMDQESNGVRVMEGYAHWHCAHRHVSGYDLA